MLDQFMGWISQLKTKYKQAEQKNPEFMRGLLIGAPSLFSLVFLIVNPMGFLASICFLSLFGFFALALNFLLGPIVHFILFGSFEVDTVIDTIRRYQDKKRNER